MRRIRIGIGISDGGRVPAKVGLNLATGDTPGHYKVVTSKPQGLFLAAGDTPGHYKVSNVKGPYSIAIGDTIGHFKVS